MKPTKRKAKRKPSARVRRVDLQPAVAALTATVRGLKDSVSVLQGAAQRLAALEMQVDTDDGRLDTIFARAERLEVRIVNLEGLQARLVHLETNRVDMRQHATLRERVETIGARVQALEEHGPEPGVSVEALESGAPERRPQFRVFVYDKDDTVGVLLTREAIANLARFAGVAVPHA